MTRRKRNKLPAIKRDLPTPTRNQNGILRFMNNLITTMSIGGQMSEQGADKVGKDISEGFRFFLKACGIGLGIAFLFWQSPDFLKALAEFILTLKNG